MFGIELSNLIKSKREMISDTPELSNATVRACPLVLVRNVMIAPIKDIKIINEMKADIYNPPSLSKIINRPIPKMVMDA